LKSVCPDAQQVRFGAAGKSQPGYGWLGFEAR
jgi:hypothetical protein